jgi:NADPH:quinone reductase-like Zn-dependent oxidoreductase
VIGTARADIHGFPGCDYGTCSLGTLTPRGVLLDAVGDDAAGDPRYHRFDVSPSGAELALVTELIEAGRLRVHVGQVFPLEEQRRRTNSARRAGSAARSC